MSDIGITLTIVGGFWAIVAWLATGWRKVGRAFTPEAFGIALSLVWVGLILYLTR